MTQGPRVRAGLGTDTAAVRGDRRALQQAFESAPWLTPAAQHPQLASPCRQPLSAYLALLSEGSAPAAIWPSSTLLRLPMAVCG